MAKSPYNIDLSVKPRGLEITVTGPNGLSINQVLDPRESRLLANSIISTLTNERRPQPEMPVNRTPIYQRSLGGANVWVYIEDGATSLISGRPDGSGLFWVQRFRLQPRIVP